MELRFQINDKIYKTDARKGHSLAIPLCFNGPQPNAFGVPQATAEVYRAGSFIGNTDQGGSCNCEIYHLTPHGNGTHSESSRHIQKNGPSIAEALEEGLCPCTVVSLTPQPFGGCGETYNDLSLPKDLVVTRSDLLKTLRPYDEISFQRSLVVRTLPNEGSKQSRNYADKSGAHYPPYFTLEAMRLIAESEVQHLLVDLPSIDRLDDGGKLANHHTFWNPMQENHHHAKTRTITEMIFAENHIPDGYYLLDLQIPHFTTDAAPSRPIVYPVEAE